MGEKEALAFLKKSNKSLIVAWESYKLQIGHSENKQLNDVFRQMFKAWTLSNQKAIDFSNDAYFDARHRYNADKALDNAFRTFQKDSQQQLKIEQEKQRNRYRSNYFGYNYGYSPHYYSWGW